MTDTPISRPTLVIFNGSISGRSGNSQAVLEAFARSCSWAKTEVVELADRPIEQTDLERLLQRADAFVFASGTYWDSWGSPLQVLLERLTEFEGKDVLLGKPCAIIITMHSVGGKELVSRLQGVLNSMGLLIPPMTGFAYSLASHLALQTESEFKDDFWRLEDLEIVSANLRIATLQRQSYVAWPVDRKDPTRRWLMK
jgi:multimeric flavodoxin WrbA